MLGLGPIARDVVTDWAMQRQRPRPVVRRRTQYKVQTVLHPVEEHLTWTNEAIEGAI
jgi:hypothetical protein